MSNRLDLSEKFRQAIDAPPPILCWLNYFDAAIFAAIGQERFAALPGCKIETAASGVLVYLSDHPWTARLARLASDGKYHIFAAKP